MATLERPPTPTELRHDVKHVTFDPFDGKPKLKFADDAVPSSPSSPCFLYISDLALNAFLKHFLVSHYLF